MFYSLLILVGIFIAPECALAIVLINNGFLFLSFVAFSWGLWKLNEEKKKIDHRG